MTFLPFVPTRFIDELRKAESLPLNDSLQATKLMTSKAAPGRVRAPRWAADIQPVFYAGCVAIGALRLQYPW